MNNRTENTGYVELQGIRMYHEVHGEPVADAPPLVLIHGGMFTVEQWRPLMERLGGRRQVIAVELQGHGRTLDTGRDMSIAQYAEDVSALLSHLQLLEADVLGFSLGGWVALELGVRHPHVVRRLVILSAFMRPDGFHGEVFGENYDPESPRMPTEAEFGAAKDTNLRFVDEATFEEAMERTGEMVHAFQGWTVEEIGSIAAPTMVVVGDTDFLKLDHAIEMFETIPDAQLAVLPGTTHMGMMESDERLAALVTPFLT